MPAALQKRMFFMSEIRYVNFISMIRNLDTALLRAFVTVVGTGNMTVAGERLGLTQGAVSQQIRRLEDSLQCVLFDRSQRGLKLTRQAHTLLEPARRLLEINDEIWNEMTAPASRGEVRLGIPHDLVASYLPLALDGFVDANPGIEVTLITGASPELREGLAKGNIDVAIAEEPLGNTDGETLSVERLLWVGGSRGSAHAKRPLPLSMVAEDCSFRPPVVDALRGRDIDWRTVFENGTIDATMTTVRSDLAVTVSLASLVPEDLEVLGRAEGLPDLPSFAVNMYVGDREASSAAGELARHLRDGVHRQQRRRA